MADNSKYFYISGFISLFLFSLFFLLFFMMLFSSSKINSYALNKNTFVSISLDNIKTKKLLTTKAPSSIIQPIKKPVDIPSENVDVNDLFSDVWTKKISKKKEKPKNLKRIAQLQQQIPLSQKNVSQIKEQKQIPASSNAEEVNEYLAKIQAIVYEHFNVPANSEGNSVKTLIELTSLGKLIDFRVLTYSSNDALNEEVDKIKKRLLNVIFPINKQNNSTRTIVILTSKE